MSTKTPITYRVNIDDFFNSKDGFVVNCDRLRLREDASTEASVLATIEKNDIVKVIGNANDDFYTVIWNDGFENITGYCMKKYIRFKKAGD